MVGTGGSGAGRPTKKQRGRPPGGAKAIAVALPPTAHGAPTATSQLAASAGAGYGKPVVGTGGRFGLGVRVAGKEESRYYLSCG